MHRLFAFSSAIVLAACGTPAPLAPDGGELLDAAVVSDAADARPPIDDDGGAPAEHDVLFVGNSYVFVHDVAGHYREIARALSPDVRVEEVTAGGYLLEQHAADARTDGTELARFLRTGTPEETSFDAVVLQEQSQLGGFPAYHPQRRASVAAASELAALATARGARVVLYLTWGREHGDPDNAPIGFDTYVGMQDRLDAGYVGLAALLREQGADALVAPVGGGFRIVHEDVTRAGGDPAAEGSDFDALYDPDGSHPSLRGAYLASCIIAGTITGADPRTFADEPELGAEVSSRLRDVCARALVDPRWDVPAIVRAGAVLEGDGEQPSFFGSSVAIGADGARVLIGAPARASESMLGSARVFVRDAAGGAWSEEALWTGSPGFGSAVALSADGLRALVGPGAGYARTASTWSDDAPLTIEPATGLAISGDGTRAIVAVPGGGTVGPDVVVARMLVRSGGAWTAEGVATGRSAAWLAATVSMDEAGERAIVGERPCRVYVRTDAGWSVEAELPIDVGRARISADGTHAVVGQPDRNRAIVLARDGATWSEVATLRVPPYQQFGASVALSADGRRVLVGVPSDRPVATGAVSGSVHVYALRDGVYRLEHLLVPPLPLVGTAPQLFGEQLAVSPDGRTVIVGSPSAETASAGVRYAGVVHVATLP